jgi:hypothetical protein
LSEDFVSGKTGGAFDYVDFVQAMLAGEELRMKKAHPANGMRFGELPVERIQASLLIL